MAQYFYENDLYNDLFLNNTREMYIKMLLLDYAEPTITDFFIDGADLVTVPDGVKASRITVPYSSHIEDGDFLTFNAIDLDVARGCTVSWVAGSSYFISTDRTISGNQGDYVATLSDSVPFSSGMEEKTEAYSLSMFDPANNYINPIEWISGTTIKFKYPLASSSVAGPITITIKAPLAKLNVSNFYVSSMSTFNSQYSPPGYWYSANKYNSIIISKKEIQGYITSGSLKVDGNSPMRRTIDFSCIIDKLYGTSNSLKLHDFDNKKIKVLIGIKNSVLSNYDYTQYFKNNGTQEDLKGIVWFKLGVFIPRSINIKHSVDSYSISVTAQDKTSSLDGSFGGVLGSGREFRDPTSGQNTSFYDTIKDSFSLFTQEPSDKISISLADPFEINKEPYDGEYLTYGSNVLKIKDASNLFNGMEIQSPGLYSGTKIQNIIVGSPYSTVYMTDIAYDSVNTNQFIFKDNKLIRGVTFSYPSYKNFFAIQPLVKNNSDDEIYIKPTQINFKGSTYSYNVYTTIASWRPTTWGSVTKNSLETLALPVSIEDITILPQNIFSGNYSTSSNLVAGDFIVTFQDAALANFGLSTNTFYRVRSSSTSTNGTFTLEDLDGNPQAGGPSTQSVDVRKFYDLYNGIIPTTNNKIIKKIKYNSYDSSYGVLTRYTSGNSYVYSINKYLFNKNYASGVSELQTTAVTLPITNDAPSIAFYKGFMFLAVNSPNLSTTQSRIYIYNSSTYQFISSMYIPSPGIAEINADSNGYLYQTNKGQGINKYQINSTNGSLALVGTGPLLPDQQSYRLMAVDSKNYIYTISDVTGVTILTKFDSKFNKILTKDLTSFGYIYSLSIDKNDNLYFLINSYAPIQVLNSEDFSYIVQSGINGNLLDYTNAQIIGPYLIYPVSEASQNRLIQLPINYSLHVTNINALKELAPQTDSTIVKASSDKVTSILEDVKSQLGVYQYYYDFDGNFIFREDKRLSFEDSTLTKINPYSFGYNDYNLNVSGISFAYNFLTGSSLISDFNNSIDLSTFKNDFFVYGTKKGLDVSVDNLNIPILYHIMIDDLTLKNTSANYTHPWQQYILDQGLAGTTYADFIYFQEIKENFEFKYSRDYSADSSVSYVSGEYILVKNILSGVSSASSYSLYEVVIGGTPATAVYPTKKDGGVEYLNQSLPIGTGLAVKYYCSVKGQDYEKFQGVYKKFPSNSINKKVSLKKGEYFLYNNYICQMSEISYINSDTTTGVLDADIPISVNLSTAPFKLSSLQIGQKYPQTFAGTNASFELGGIKTKVYITSCSFDVTVVGTLGEGIFKRKYSGLFRKDNSGVLSTDFAFDADLNKELGDPGSWSYYYDIVNIIGNYTTDNKPVGITGWAPMTYYDRNTLVYSDNKIYQAIIPGLSSPDASSAPTGFGDENNLIKDYSFTQLTWHLNQISIDFNKMKVSAIGSRKSSIYDKDINILFATKDQLEYFTKEGYYFVVLNDFIGFDGYSVDFHNRLENLIKQFSVLYPKISLIFVPESQVVSDFYINKLTTLKDAFSTLKKNFYLNFVGGQSININSIPMYDLEPLGIIKVADEDSDLFGNFVLTDYVVPLSNEGMMTMNGVKTNPYDDGLTTIPQVLTNFDTYNSATAFYNSNRVVK